MTLNPLEAAFFSLKAGSSGATLEEIREALEQDAAGGADAVVCSYCDRYCQSRCIESQDARAADEATDDARASE